ncbi:MAG TPA: carboxypeptidase regulatory-like domain-containing protein, partial [Pyrinomonadaceae bacterium]|nr:carboxypeptidase regulatory-like domain-containing protein [Pyrinomonadaceae bacterium]
MLRLFTLVLFPLIVAAGGVPAVAQTQATAGQIVGTIKDPQGAAVANATVTVSNPSIGFSQNFTTNESGEFSALQLKPGNYTVEVTATGFGTFTQTGYQVEVGSALPANITLGLQNVTEEVTVTAASVETTQVQTPTNINETSISQLPINGRRFQDFVLLTPSAQIDPVRQQISLVGQRGINSNVQIDGADYNNPFFGGLRGGERSNNAFTIPQGAIREFQVVTSGYNAEFGRSTGGIVNAVTKSGTNEFTGSAFYVNRPAKLAHKNAFTQIAAPTQQQYGGALGGPLFLPRFGEGGSPTYGAKDKAFFFVAYEEQRLDQTRAVLFNNLRGTGIDPATPGLSEALGFALDLEGPYKQTNNAKAFLTRFDFNLNQQNQFNVRYNYSTNTALNAVTAGTSLTPTTNSALSNNGTEGDRQHTFVGQLTSFFSSTVVNELRGQYSREERPRLANEFSPLIQAQFGNFGTVSFLPTTQDDYRIQIADNLTGTTGAHTFKVGGEFNYVKANQVFAQRQTGNFTFIGLGTDPASVIQVLRILSVGGNGTANANGNVTGAYADPTNRFDDTRVRYTRQTGNGQLSFSSPQFAAFAQDAWRIRSNFTLNYGLRYEAQLFPTPEANNTQITDLVANAAFPLGRIDPRVIRDQTNQWAPRLGFAWDPWNDGKGVIRGFGGIYYATTPLLTLAGPINNFRTPPGDLSVQLPSTGLPASLNTVYKQFRSIGVDLNNYPLNALPILTVDQVNQILANIAAAGGAPRNPLSGLQLITAGDAVKNPRSTQFGASIERELLQGLTVGATFDYVNTVHLNFNRDFDLPTPIIRAGDLSERPYFGIVTGVQNRPITALGNTGYVQVRDSAARSLYRGLTIRGQLRRKFGQFDAFYTLSKNLDSDSSERNSSFATYDNAYNLAPEYNFSLLDRRHQLVVNSVINAPFGFELGTTARFLSAAPIDVSVSSIVAPAGSGLTSAQYAAQVTLSGSTTGDLNQDAGNFSDRPYISPGVTSLRNSYRNRPFYNVDFRVQRNFRFGER